ncbi:hypothetical protein EXIGLDRAFT_783277 [Exidia glandulosa HHB12029]|uniref:Uncharacterized protein n=1 Tax=Exidia glandulosa HHB12029 TaxID=1314781 RepID=A0A166N5I9_EXIGL|nr:hypothetical protein EXIGLDRAFT_783277 [Exidia glandulosa HHB12029]
MFFLRAILFALGVFIPLTDLIFTAVFIRGGLIAVLQPFSPTVASTCVALASPSTCATISRWLQHEDEDSGSPGATAQQTLTPCSGDVQAVCIHVVSVNDTMHVPPLDLFIGQTTVTDLLSQAKTLDLDLADELFPTLETTAAGARIAVAASHSLNTNLDQVINAVNRTETILAASLKQGIGRVTSLRQGVCSIVGWIVDPLVLCGERRLPSPSRDNFYAALENAALQLHDFDLSVQDVVNRLEVFVGDANRAWDMAWAEETAAGATLAAIMRKAWTTRGNPGLEKRRDLSQRIRLTVSQMRCAAQGELLALSALHAEVAGLRRALDALHVTTCSAADDALHALINGRQRLAAEGEKVEQGFRSRLSVNVVTDV